MVDTNGRAVVTGGAPPDFGVSEKRTEREIDSPITISTLRFENLTTALLYYVLPNYKLGRGPPKFT